MSFNTQRPMSADEKFEKLLATKKARTENMDTLRRSSIKVTDDYSRNINATLESIDMEAERDCKRDTALDNMRCRQDVKTKSRAKLSLYNKLFNEGVTKLTNDTIYKIVYNSLWIDDAVKISMSDNLKSEYCTIMDNIKKEFCGSKCSNDTLYIQNVKSAIQEVTEKACRRIVEDADLNDDYNVSFETNEDEDNELDRKLSDLGTDQIVQLVKDKVLTVVQDEQKAGIAKKDLMKEIEDSKKEQEEMGKDKLPNENIRESWFYMHEAVDFEQDRDKFEVIFRRGCEAVSTKHYEDAISDLKRSLVLIDRIEKSIYAKDISDMNQANRCMQFYNACQSIAPSNFRRNMPSYTTSDFLKREDNVYADVMKSARELVNELIKYCDNEGEYSDKEKDRRGIEDSEPEEVSEGIKEFAGKVKNNATTGLSTIKRRFKELGDNIRDNRDINNMKITRSSIIDDINESEYGELAKIRAEVVDEITKYESIVNDKARTHKNKLTVENYKNHIKWLKTIVIPKIDSRMNKLEKYDNPQPIKRRMKDHVSAGFSVTPAGIMPSVTVKSTHESMDMLIAKEKTRKLNNTTGSSLFEALLINSLKSLEEACGKKEGCNEEYELDVDDEVDEEVNEFCKSLEEGCSKKKSCNEEYDYDDEFEDDDDDYDDDDDCEDGECDDEDDDISLVSESTNKGSNNSKASQALKEFKGIISRIPSRYDISWTNQLSASMKYVEQVWTTALNNANGPKSIKSLQKIANREIKAIDKGAYDKQREKAPSETKHYEKWVKDFKKKVDAKAKSIEKNPDSFKDNKNANPFEKISAIIKDMSKIDAECDMTQTMASINTSKQIIMKEIKSTNSITYLKSLKRSANMSLVLVDKALKPVNNSTGFNLTTFGFSKNKRKDVDKLFTDYAKWLKTTCITTIDKKIAKLEKSKGAVKESMGFHSNLTTNDLNTAALYEAMFAYTIMETLNTIKLYDFKPQDIRRYSRKLTFSK